MDELHKEAGHDSRFDIKGNPDEKKQNALEKEEVSDFDRLKTNPKTFWSYSSFQPIFEDNKFEDLEYSPKTNQFRIKLPLGKFIDQIF